MDDNNRLVSNAFQVFMQQAPAFAQVWLGTTQGLAKASALDRKTECLGYIAVLAVLGLTNGIPFHVTEAKQAGASREEIISAVLLGLPAAGNIVIAALPIALSAFDNSD